MVGGATVSAIAKPKTVPLPSDPRVTWRSVPLRVLARGQRRLEGDAYLSSGYEMQIRLESGRIPAQRLDQLARIWQPGRLKGVVVAREHGVPFLTTNQVFDRRPVVRKWIAPNQTSDLASRFVRSGWVLITRSGNGVAGNVGKVIASYSAHADVVISDDMLRLEPNRAEDLGFLYAFLRSRFGRAMLRSNQYGSTIKHLEPEHVESLPVPDVEPRLRAWLDVRVAHSYALRDAALALSRSADEMFASGVGLVVPPLQDERGYSLPLARLVRGRRRLDAHHYNPTAEAVLAGLRRAGVHTAPLRDLVDRVFMPPRFKRVPSEQGFAYLDSEDIFKVNPDITKRIAPPEKGPSAYRVKERWVLMARSGQLYGISGNVVLATAAHEDKLLSEDVLRIVPKSATGVRPGYLQVALGHQEIGRPLVLRCAFGSSVPHIPPEDLLNVPVARLAPDLENQIAEFAERASELRLEADRVEDDAVHAIESYVEGLLSSQASATRGLDMSVSPPPPLAISVAEETRWHEYLAALALRQPAATAAQLRAAGRLWSTARAHGGAPLLPPITTPSEDGTLRLAWNNAALYLEVTFDAAGRAEWFYRDTRAGTFEGTEDEWLDAVPERVFDLLPSFASQGIHD